MCDAPYEIPELNVDRFVESILRVELSHHFLGGVLRQVEARGTAGETGQDENQQHDPDQTE